MSTTPHFTLTLSCNDAIGIVHAITGVLAACGCNIVDSSQFNDTDTGRFFMRVSFVAPEAKAISVLNDALAPVAKRFGMDWQLHDRRERPRILLMVSKFDHCLRDLLYRVGMGEMAVDVALIVSNHPDARGIAESYGIPFHHLPVTPVTKTEQENAVLALIEDYDVELVVLARYMQILSDDLCRALSGRAINIHHSFLPSFKGAKPYHQAHARGVKIIGATAHFVTADLDEGPIIEQDVARVRHDRSPEELVSIGRDVERLVLARAVRLYAERRILMNGTRTIVFD